MGPSAIVAFAVAGIVVAIVGESPWEAATLMLEQRGMRRADIHADAFYTAAEMATAGKKTGADQ